MVSQIKEKTILVLDTVLHHGTSPGEMNQLFEDIFYIMSQKSPTWHVERDAKMRGWSISIKAEAREA